MNSVADYFQEPGFLTPEEQATYDVDHIDAVGRDSTCKVKDQPWVTREVLLLEPDGNRMPVLVNVFRQMKHQTSVESACCTNKDY